MKSNFAYNKDKKIFDVIIWKIDGSMLYKTLSSGFWKEEEFRFLSVVEAEKLFKFQKEYPNFKYLHPNEASLNYILLN